KSSKDIAVLLDMPLRVVQWVRKLWTEIGEVSRDRRGHGRSPLMSSVGIEFMLGLLEHSPDLYLDELQDQLFVLHGLDVSLAIIARTLKQLGITSKAISCVASELSEEARRNFAYEISKETPDRIVCVDESAVNVLTTYWLNGW
ncbi:hypothetical protein BJ138DRAFT_974421, partial [Hygrophoropsis aurantiaca]